MFGAVPAAQESVAVTVQCRGDDRGGEAGGHDRKRQIIRQPSMWCNGTASWPASRSRDPAKMAGARFPEIGNISTGGHTAACKPISRRIRLVMKEPARAAG